MYEAQGQFNVCLPMVWETGVQSQVAKYQRLKNGTW